MPLCAASHFASRYRFVPTSGAAVWRLLLCLWLCVLSAAVCSAVCGCLLAVCWLSGSPAEGLSVAAPRVCAPAADKGRDGGDSQWGSNSSLTAGPRSRRGSNASLYGGEF